MVGSIQSWLVGWFPAEQLLNWVITTKVADINNFESNKVFIIITTKLWLQYQQKSNKVKIIKVLFHSIHLEGNAMLNLIFTLWCFINELDPLMSPSSGAYWLTQNDCWILIQWLQTEESIKNYYNCNRWIIQQLLCVGQEALELKFRRGSNS